MALLLLAGSLLGGQLLAAAPAPVVAACQGQANAAPVHQLVSAWADDGMNDGEDHFTSDIAAAARAAPEVLQAPPVIAGLRLVEPPAAAELAAGRAAHVPDFSSRNAILPPLRGPPAFLLNG
jgi:hypothetical protein